MHDGAPTNVTAALRTHPSDTEAGSADFFMRNFRNMTIDVGRNPHADGVRWYGNNSSILKDVRVIGTGRIGINAGFLGQNGPSLVQGARVEGSFETGIRCAWNWGQTLSRVTVRGAKQEGVSVNATAVGVDLRSPGRRLWVRQLNPEGDSDVGLVQNHGGRLWALGVKHEGRGVRFLIDGGGETEILGLFNYAPDIAGPERRQQSSRGDNPGTPSHRPCGAAIRPYHRRRSITVPRGLVSNEVLHALHCVSNRDAQPRCGGVRPRVLQCRPCRRESWCAHGLAAVARPRA